MEDLRERLALLTQAAVYDDAAPGEVPSSDVEGEGRGFFAPASGDERPVNRSVLPCVSHHIRPDGRSEAVLKVLQTSACENNCNYCAFRAGRDTRRTRVTPDELARSFDLMHRGGLVEGMFLSSGVIGTNRTMDEMLATIELVRTKYAFRGYIHLKLLPNVEPAHVERAVELADRVSMNLEGPTQERLDFLAPKKTMAELLAPLRVAANLRRKAIEAERASANVASAGSPYEKGGDGRGYLRSPDHPRSPSQPAWGHAWLGLSTQFVVGPAGETDQELLTVVDGLYRELHLSRTYFSAFTPVKRTPLEGMPPTHPVREHRLYQADWLLRFYGFRASELPFTTDGQLRTDVDPKAAWAKLHPEQFPIEINRAPLSQLLRIPGIGPQSARAILQARTAAPLREIGDLRRLGARADLAAPFVLLNGKRPPYQLRLPYQTALT